MTRYENARRLVEHCECKLSGLREVHTQCLAKQLVKPEFLIDVKNQMENLRSALDYCAAALFAKYGRSTKSNPKIYFPYAKHGDDRMTFREKTVEICIPGLLESRPDIVHLLETYQHFGNTGNWLPLLAEIANENKHVQLTPQIQKQYQMVQINGTIPPGGTLEIDLTKIPLGGGPDKPFHAVVGIWTGLVFTNTGVMVMPFLEHAVRNVRRAVEELSLQ